MGDKPLVMDPDGTITIVMPFGSMTLTYPTLRQYREFRNAISARLDAVKELRDKVVAKEATEEEQRLFLTEQSNIVVGWVVEVFDELAPADIDSDWEVDDWPAWLSNPRLPMRWLNHWQTAPFGSGN